MDEVIEYLEMKNHFYEKFESVTEKFILTLTQDKWDELEFFVESREKILSILRSFDLKIERAMNDHSEATHSEADKERIQAIMNKREAIAKRILNLDLQLISIIDDYKSDTIRELKAAMETDKQLDSFSRVPEKRPVKVVKV